MIGSSTLSLDVSVPLDHEIVIEALEVIGVGANPGFQCEAGKLRDWRPATTLVVAVDVSTWSMDVA